MKGLEMASKRRIQLIRETYPGVYNANGTRIMMISLRGGLVPDEQFGNFRPAGYNVDSWNALSATHSIFNASVVWDYSQTDTLMELLCGEPVDTTTDDGVVTKEYRLPESGEREVLPFTLEDGSLTSCDRATYCFLTALSFSQERMGDAVSGNLTMLCRKPEATGVAMTGATAQNEIKTITLEDAAAPGTIVVPATSLGAGGNVTVTPGMSAAALKTALAAKASIALEANISVTGTTTAVTTGDNVAAGATVVNTAGGGTPANLFDGNTATQAVDFANNLSFVAIDLGAAKNISTLVMYLNSGVTAGKVFKFYDSDATGAKGAEIGSVTIPGPSQTFTTPLVLTGKRYIYMEMVGAGTGGGLAVNEIRLLETAGLGNGEYVIEFIGALAETNIGNFTTVSDGYINATTQNGGDGVISIPARNPVLPQHITTRIADDLADLDEADSQAKGVRMSGFDLGALAAPIWFQEEGETTFAAHVDGENPTQVCSVELSTRILDEPPATGTVANPAHDQLLARSAAEPATPQWVGIRARKSDGYGLDAQFFCSANAVAEITAANNVRARRFPMSCVLSDEGYSARFLTHAPV